MLDVDFFALLAALKFELAFVVVRKSVAATNRIEFFRATRTLARGQTWVRVREEGVSGNPSQEGKVYS